MIVGASVVELHIHGCRSLKAKRGVVRSITRRVRNRFNLSVAEVGAMLERTSAVVGQLVGPNLSEGRDIRIPNKIGHPCAGGCAHRGGQIARALHATLAGRVGVSAQQEQGEWCRLHSGG